jgi:hypothetical protein
MKKLLILFLFLPSISYAGTAYDNNVKRDCKNINKIEIMSQKEINLCFRSLIHRNLEELKVNIANVDQLYDSFQ